MPDQNKPADYRRGRCLATHPETVVHIAIPIGDQVTPLLNIRGDHPLPNNPGDPLNVIRDRLDNDAAKIVNALTASLPQGTLGRVFALLAKKYATDLAVRI